MKKLLLALVVVLTGCSSTSPPASLALSDTMEIIEAAASAAPDSVLGEYTLHIVASGAQNHFVYLNTEKDYRDQRAVTVALNPRIISQLTAKYGMSPEQFFVDKTIVVAGEAQRVKIILGRNHKPTDKYYYQTHIRLMDISQILAVYEHA